MTMLAGCNRYAPETVGTWNVLLIRALSTKTTGVDMVACVGLRELLDVARRRWR